MKEWIRMQEDGRILIPAEIRKQMNAMPGEKVLLVIDEFGNLKLQSRINALKEAQKYFVQFKKDGESIVDEFLNEKGAEALKEMEEYNA